MKTMSTTLIGFFIAGLCVYAVGCEKQGNSNPREDLYHMTLVDGSVLCMHTSTGRSSNEPQKKSAVHILLHPEGSKYLKQRAIWGADFTSVDYMPVTESYYALVKVIENRIFIFATWNREYCVIDKRTGTIIEKGDGDASLKEYDSVVPLKLWITFGGPSSGRTVTLSEQEARELDEEKERDEAAAELLDRVNENGKAQERSDDGQTLSK